MIIVRTPLRVSLFGGGTDTPSYYQHAPRGGAVLGFALNHYVYLTVRALPNFHEHRVRLVYSRVELADRPDQLVHPAARAVLGLFNWQGGIEVTHAADLPSRAGLGSSSAFVVGLINAVDYIRGQVRGPEGLARLAIIIERQKMGEPGGEQDQIFAARGDLLKIDFGSHDPTSPFDPPETSIPEFGGKEWHVRRPPVSLARQEELLSHLLLAFTGEVRDAPRISASLDLSPDSAYLARMRAQVDEAEEILLSDSPIEAIGELLDEAWDLKRRLSPLVATAVINDTYERARAAGAIGGKVLGAGGGGFILLFARPRDHQTIRAALPNLVFVPVGIDRAGSRIIANGIVK